MANGNEENLYYYTNFSYKTFILNMLQKIISNNI